MTCKFFLTQKLWRWYLLKRLNLIPSNFRAVNQSKTMVASSKDFVKDAHLQGVDSREELDCRWVKARQA
jgi:hypothetical protein